MIISKKEFTKLEYLVGFVNNIIEIVSDPEEDLDPNTKDSSIYSVGYFQNEKGNLQFCSYDDVSITDFKENLRYIERRLKDIVSVDSTKEWEKLRK